MISQQHYQMIRELESFQYFNREVFDQLASKMTCRQVPAHHILFFEGDPKDYLFILLDGYVKLEQADQTGNFVYLDYVKNRTLFPYSCLFIDKGYPFTATTVTPASYIFLPLKLYEDYAAKNLRLMTFLYRKLAKLFDQHELRIRNTVTSSAKKRVIQSLALLYLDFFAKSGSSGTLPFPITTIDIAQMSGTTRETVSHVLKDLKQRQLISYQRKQLTFLDPAYFLKHMD